MKENRSLVIKSFIAGAVVMAIVMILIRQAVLWLPVSSYVDNPTSVNAVKKTKEITRYIDRFYLGDVDEQKLVDYMYLGLVTGLEDPYSTYYTKTEYDDINMSQQGEYRGVGISITNREEDNALMITAITAGGPAERAGLLAGDLILTLNGQDFHNTSTTKAAEFVRTAEGDTIEITVLREETGEELSFTVDIEKLEAYSVSYGMAEDQIGYIYISSFTAVTSKQFEEARRDLEEQGMKALIIDLRNNTGGLVSAVYDLLRSMMPEGLLFYTETKDGTRKEFYSDGEDPITIPMAVLVNESTASASEIFAGAVKDYGVATIIGSKTYGKGIVQNAYTLSDGSVLRLTVSHYYTPKGNDIHENGIIPDIDPGETPGADLAYKKAVNLLKEKTAASS